MHRMDFGLGGHDAGEPRRVVLFDRLVTDEEAPRRIAFRALGNRLIPDVKWNRIDHMNLRGEWQLSQHAGSTEVTYTLQYALCAGGFFWGIVMRLQDSMFRAKFQRTMSSTLAALKHTVEKR